MSNKYRTIWISDTHIGSFGCQAETLDRFLKENTADTLYLVGDIIDLWALKRKIYFPKSHLNLLKRVIAISKKTRVIYVVGNHDETIRHFIPFTVGDIEVVRDAVHSGVNGKTYFVTHGDEFDQVMKYARWLAWLGDIGYNALLKSNAYVNWVRRKFGLGYWSLSAFAKKKVKGAVNFIGDYETAVAKSVAERGYDGVVCGHIHSADDKFISNVRYLNCGDFVESCTALVEEHDGRIYVRNVA